MMRGMFSMVVVIPVGPGSQLHFVRDTIASVIHHCRESFKIVIADNSQEGIGIELKKELDELDIFECKPKGSMAGLYVTLSNAFNYALKKYDFNILLKLDTDALIIGDFLYKDAMSFFEDNPSTAIAGQYPFDYTGKPWDIGWPRARIINGTMTWKFIKRPFANLLLRKLYVRALKNGYRTGESVFGGAYFMSRPFLEKCEAYAMLPNHRLRGLNIGEDHLFSLLAKALGFELGNLSSQQLPFACAWKGLPDSPEHLVQQGKKIIHSTRGWQEMQEPEIREYFKIKRSTKQASDILEDRNIR